MIKIGMPEHLEMQIIIHNGNMYQHRVRHCPEGGDAVSVDYSEDNFKTHTQCTVLSPADMKGLVQALSIFLEKMGED